MASRLNQSAEKAKTLVEKFIIDNDARNNEEFTNTVTFATAKEIEKLRPPTSKDYFNEINKKTTKSISDLEIIVNSKQENLNLIFRNGLNIRDLSNPMFCEEYDLNKKNFSTNIIKADRTKNKVSVIYGGDLLGTEWLIKHLNNARILKDIIEEDENELDKLMKFNEEKGEYEYNGDYFLKHNLIYDEEKKNLTIRKALYYGLKERKKILKKDIEFALSHNIEVFLFDGAQEHKVNKYFKINVLSDIVHEINNPYLHYINGVNSIINIAKESKSKKIYATIGIQTNNSISKSQKASAAINAVGANSGVSCADVVFITNTNVAGKVGNNCYCVSGEATYKTTPNGKLPKLSPKNGNVFSLHIDDWKNVSVIQGIGQPKPNFLEIETYNEMKKNELIKERIVEIARRKLETICPSGFDNDRVKSKYFSNLGKLNKSKNKTTEENRYTDEKIQTTIESDNIVNEA